MNSGKTYTYFSSLPRILSRSYDYVMKADDDVFIRLAPLALSLEPLPRLDLYYGFVIPCTSINPHVDYMSGMGFLLSWDIVEWIGNSNIPENNTNGPEDKLVGKWLKMGNKAKNRFSNKPAMYDYPGTNGRCSHELIPETVAVHRLKSMSELFSLSVHNGGYFTNNPRKYVGGKVDIVDNCELDKWSKTKIEGICREFGYTSVSRIWYKMPGNDLERANFHLIVDNDDVMFMTDLVIGHEEIHVFLEHLVDNPILVDESEHVGTDVQPLAVEQNLLRYGSNDEGSDNSTKGSEDCNNNNEDHIEVDTVQAYSRRESNTSMVEEVDDDDVVEVDVTEVYFRRVSKEPMTQHPSENKDVVDSSDSGEGDGEGSGLEDEDVVNPVAQFEESSSNDDIGDDTNDNSKDELKTHVGKGMGQKKTFLVFKPVAKAKHIRFEKDMLFTTPKQFKECIIDYAIHGGWGIRFAKNDL
nr:hypothetical protein CFP56_64045 [Quercus suber]